jgi:hypothetical protein
MSNVASLHLFSSIQRAYSRVPTSWILATIIAISLEVIIEYLGKKVDFRLKKKKREDRVDIPAKSWHSP